MTNTPKLRMVAALLLAASFIHAFAACKWLDTQTPCPMNVQHPQGPTCTLWTGQYYTLGRDVDANHPNGWTDTCQEGDPQCTYWCGPTIQWWSLFPNEQVTGSSIPCSYGS